MLASFDTAALRCALAGVAEQLLVSGMSARQDAAEAAQSANLHATEIFAK